jgi:hypothetical protein
MLGRVDQAKSPQKSLGGEQLNPGAVIRPNWQTEGNCESQEVDIIRISLAEASRCSEIARL